MPVCLKKCAHCGEEFRATCGVAKFCSDRCHLLASIEVDEGGCWNWKAGLDKDGYGVVRLRGRRRRKAHRASYEEFEGPVSDEEMVCHSCDRPGCINPQHLFLGDALANKTDSVVKCRHVHGAGVYWKAKLTEEQARIILQDDRSAPVIAAEYGIHRNSIYAIRKRKIWKHLTA